MKELFVNYKQALALKGLGFVEPCFGHYSSEGVLNNVEDYVRVNADVSQMLHKKFNSELYMGEICSAPLFSQAFKFFREKFSLEGSVVCIIFNSKRLKGYQYIIISQNYNSFEQLGNYYTYEQAEIACLDKLISLTKTKQS